LGGGGTDLPSYYKRRGGFILTSAIDKYMYVAVNTPFIDRLVRVKYSVSETVESVDELKHDLAREAMKHYRLRDALEIISFADISAGTGMGSSSSYLVGLLKALAAYCRRPVPVETLAETAAHIEIDILGKPIGKQDAYIASYGGILVMEISKRGNVRCRPAAISMATLRDMERNLLVFFTGKRRQADEVLLDQNEAMRASGHTRHCAVAGYLDRIKELGYETLRSLEEGRTERFARLMDRHWAVKRRLSPKISHPDIDRAYQSAKAAGALGGKLLGAGGGGFLVLYAESSHAAIDRAMAGHGMRRLDCRFDFEGAKVLVNLVDSRIEQQLNRSAALG